MGPQDGQLTCLAVKEREEEMTLKVLKKCREESRSVLKLSCTLLCLEHHENKILRLFTLLERFVLNPVLLLSSILLLLSAVAWVVLKIWSSLAGGIS